MKKAQIIHFIMLCLALVLTSILLPLGWFAAFWSYFGFLYALVWFINHKQEHKWVQFIADLF